jgi:hypothetical protein
MYSVQATEFRIKDLTGFIMSKELNQNALQNSYWNIHLEGKYPV